jgi:hypothetical protein
MEAQHNMANKIQVRRDTSANWSSTNPTLSQGEIGFEIDTNRIKVGTGGDQWNDIEYITMDLSSVINQPVLTTSSVRFGKVEVGATSTNLLNGGLSVKSSQSGNYGIVIENTSALSNAASAVTFRNNLNTASTTLVIGLGSTTYQDLTNGVVLSNSGFLYNTGGDLVLGTTESGSKVEFRAGGTLNSAAGGYLDSDGWTLNRSVTIQNDQAAPLYAIIANADGDVESTAELRLDNDTVLVSLGVNTSNVSGSKGNIGPNDYFLHSDVQSNLHLGNKGDIHFYTDPADGYATTATLTLKGNSRAAVFRGSLVPAAGVSPNIGNSSDKWNSLYLSSNTINIGNTTLVVENGNATVGGVALRDFTKVDTIPTSSTSTGTVGQIALTTASMYMCVGTDSWLRFDGVTF